ncbi:hypothetical protein J6590_088812 [Homalodisca vitripennis]|nr:hypothetical protein J6590_088812 [Homalodisca vitripennis]
MDRRNRSFLLLRLVDEWQEEVFSDSDSRRSSLRHNVNLLTVQQREFSHNATAHNATDLAKCSQRQHNRINNRIHAYSATAHSATDLFECSQRQHNRINNRIHAYSVTAHSATDLFESSQRQHNRIRPRA